MYFRCVIKIKLYIYFQQTNDNLPPPLKVVSVSIIFLNILQQRPKPNTSVTWVNTNRETRRYSVLV